MKKIIEKSINQEIIFIESNDITCVTLPYITCVTLYNR